MHLSSIFTEYGVDIKNTKLVRHPLNKTDIREVYERGMIEAYQNSQSKNIFDNCKYIAAFVGMAGTEALFIGMYEIIGVEYGEAVAQHMPQDYPYPDHFDNNHRYYDMRKMDVMADLVNKLVIDWGKGALAWFQWAENDKEVLSIASRNEIPFPGYEEVILTYTELSDIVNGDIRYQKWRDALSNVNGIYLICDTKRNKQYIGSTYNDIGILGRWGEYVKTLDGGDVGIKEHLKEYPGAHYDFQYTILRVLPKPISVNEATQVESLYKNKLCTRNEEYGLNRN
ncbi:GIY-YIG nuclease family protein [Butyrivibrio sp. XPD2006]|uniref:GIY-YIG nuclease family protein n=1 Tax=Butyrivibrio sp. XPD2006 TaxID=1280668 RepID=UPI0003B4738C|nr:GIY-YIG nuclease family protein [Butyrivibrio sp. XPD2006]